MKHKWQYQVFKIKDNSFVSSHHTMWAAIERIIKIAGKESLTNFRIIDSKETNK